MQFWTDAAVTSETAGTEPMEVMRTDQMETLAREVTETDVPEMVAVAAPATAFEAEAGAEAMAGGKAMAVEAMAVEAMAVEAGAGALREEVSADGRRAVEVAAGMERGVGHPSDAEPEAHAQGKSPPPIDISELTELEDAQVPREWTWASTEEHALGRSEEYESLLQ